MAPRQQPPAPMMLLQARVPADLDRTIRRISREDNASLNTTIITLLRAGVSSRPAKGGKEA